MSYYVDVFYDINKKSYVLIIVGSEPCPYMARISHDPPRSNYVVILKMEDKSHACGNTLQNQADISTITIAFIYPKNRYQVSYLSDSFYPFCQDCLAHGFASSC